MLAYFAYCALSIKTLTSLLASNFLKDQEPTCNLLEYLAIADWMKKQAMF